jgi:hypothetical protein
MNQHKNKKMKIYILCELRVKMNVLINFDKTFVELTSGF